MPRPLVAISLLAVLISPPATAAGFYKHVDEKGVVTYGNAPLQLDNADRSSQPGLLGAIETAAGQRYELRQTAQQKLQALLQQDIIDQVRKRSFTPLPDQEARDYRYFRPWGNAGYSITQGAHGSFSHNTPQSRFALDIALPEGTSVHAARAGVVVTARDSEPPGGRNANGNYLRIRHSDGTYSAYLHLQQGSIRVREGQPVARGQHIASSGNTGRSTGPHLHFVVQRREGARYASIPFEFETSLSTLPGFAANGD